LPLQPILVRLAGLARPAALAFVAATAAACTPPSAEGPKAPPPSLAAQFGAALEAEAKSSAEVGPYLDLIDRAVADPRADGTLAAVVAALDALVYGAAPGLDSHPAGAAYRSTEALPIVVRRLGRAWAVADLHGRGAPALPFVRGALAASLHQIALFAGDEQAAALWGTRRGCANEAAIVGPIDWTPLRGLEGPSPVSTGAEPFARTYPGVAPFAARIAPITVRADTCALDIDATTFLQGTGGDRRPP
jgi:hypothetical protein